MFGDNHVIRYTRANDVVGGFGEAQNRSGDACRFDFIIYFDYFVTRILIFPTLEM